MFYALSWAIVVGLLALWSLAAWSFHAVTAWAVSNAGTLAAGSDAIAGLPLPDWLAPLLPPEVALAVSSMLDAVIPVVQAALERAPALVDGLSMAVWLVWAVGAGLLVTLGLVSSAVIGMLRRRAAA